VQGIHITLAADSAYKRQLAVTLVSIATAHDPGTCSVAVLHQAIPARDRDLISASVAESIELTWIDVHPDVLNGLRYPSWLTSSTLVRLLIPDLLPDVDRTIYLDSDIVVVGALTELWHCDLGEELVGAVRDSSLPWAAGPLGTHWRDLGLAPETPYFNAGVLLIPLSNWRKEGIAAAALDMVRNKDLVYGDQDALNGAVQGRWLELARRWNVQTWDWVGKGTIWAIMRQELEDALIDPAIIHFTSPGRPWWPGSPHPKSALWFEYLDRTPWSGWRPPTRQPIWREAGSRARRACRVIVRGI
jgi:lipopolysaccharide biosynthesis glycosyltransferase